MKSGPRVLIRSTNRAGNGALELWELATAKLIKSVHEELPINGALALDTRFGSLAGGFISWEEITGNLKIWTAELEHVKTLTGHTSTILATTALDGGRFITGSRDQTLRIWDIVRGSCTAILEGHTQRINGIFVLPQGHIASTQDSYGDDGNLRVWDVHTKKLLKTIGPKDSGMDSAHDGACILPDGRVVIRGSRNRLWLWDGQSSMVNELKETFCTQPKILPLPDGHRVLLQSQSSSGHFLMEIRDIDWQPPENWDSMEEWERETDSCGGTRLKADTANGGRFESVQILSDGTIFCGDSRGKIYLFDGKSETALFSMHTHNGKSVNGVLELADGHLLSWGSDRALRRWTRTGEEAGVWKGHKQIPESQRAYLPDGRLLTHDEKHAYLWDFTCVNKPVAIFPCALEWISGMTVSQ